MTNKQEIKCLEMNITFYNKHKKNMTYNLVGIRNEKPDKVITIRIYNET